MKIAILLPDGVGIRNYLYSTIFNSLNTHTLQIWSTISSESLLEIRKMHSEIRFERIQSPKYKETALEKMLREITAYGRVLRNARISNNLTIRKFWKIRKNTFSNHIFYLLCAFFAHMISRSLKVILYLERLHLKLVHHNVDFYHYNELVMNEKPDVLFCTHQRAINAIPAIEAAKKCGVKTITVIYSWDNLPKGRLPIRPDYYLMWSEYMKNEFTQFYPEIPLDRVVVTGTPQFEFYKDESLLLTREQFCMKYGFDSDRPIICFSGDDKLTSPYDQFYLEDIAKVISGITKNQPQILLRRCPADHSNRYDKVIEKYSGIIKVVDPLWVHDATGLWSQFYPKFDDVALLVNVVYHCDTVINVGSTMALDFAMFDKPAIYINYDQEFAKEWSTRIIYQFQHFRSMPDKDCVCWLNDRKEIEQVIQRTLHTPQKVATSRRKWLEILINQPVELASGNISRVIKDIL